MTLQTMTLVISDFFKAMTMNRSKMHAGYLAYRCNICGELAEAHMSQLTREQPSCPHCGSTVRLRSMIHALSLELFGESLALPEFPERKELRGVGMSDWDGYAVRLKEKFDYTNTFYHKAPFLDITVDPAERVGTLDFILSTDVFEHVCPPVQTAFENARKLLKPGGVFIFSVPYKLEGDTDEHFPELYDFKIHEENGVHVLQNVTRDGRKQTFNNLVFHGGPGSTLEMRVFSENALERHFRDAGFYEAEFYKENYFDYGIFWNYFGSLPIAGRTAPKVPRKPSPGQPPTIRIWAPTQTVVGRGFNLQPNGSSALWMQGENLHLIRELRLADTPLSDITVAPGGYGLSAEVPARLLDMPGTLLLRALTNDGREIVVGDFVILKHDACVNKTPGSE